VSIDTGVKVSRRGSKRTAMAREKRPSAAAPVEFFQKEEIIMVGSMDRIPPCWARTSFACEVCGVDVSHEGGVGTD